MNHYVFFFLLICPSGLPYKCSDAINLHIMRAETARGVIQWMFHFKAGCLVKLTFLHCTCVCVWPDNLSTLSAQWACRLSVGGGGLAIFTPSLSTSHLPSLFWPATDKGEETTGELHFEREEGVKSVDSPRERGAPHLSLLNISLLQLTPSERREMQPRMRVLPWERERGRGGSLCGSPWKLGWHFKVSQDDRSNFGEHVEL